MPAFSNWTADSSAYSWIGCLVMIWTVFLWWAVEFLDMVCGIWQHFVQKTVCRTVLCHCSGSLLHKLPLWHFLLFSNSNSLWLQVIYWRRISYDSKCMHCTWPPVQPNCRDKNVVCDWLSTGLEINDLEWQPFCVKFCFWSACLRCLVSVYCGFWRQLQRKLIEIRVYVSGVDVAHGLMFLVV